MIQGQNWVVHVGNNLDILPTLPDNSVDSIVTDPPYELGFMGKKWDSSGIAYSVELWKECLRVLKPGGHLLAFSGSRTYHRMVVAIEDAGFEIRDMIAWISNKTFPKSLDVSKAIDKQAGAEREVIGKHPAPAGKSAVMTGERTETAAGFWAKGDTEVSLTAPATLEAKQWEGWGTALKPTVEPIVMARKPLIGTVAENVLTYGTGALNIDGSRIEAIDQEQLEKYWDRTQSIAAEQGRNAMNGGLKAIDLSNRKPQGRWPANVILDEYSAELLDEQSGISKDGVAVSRNKNPEEFMPMSVFGKYKNLTEDVGYGGSGGASRFFYVAKASKRDRNEGLESQNLHPTVKPTELMKYLIKLVTPPSGTVLDPFTGSGSTGKAALLEGFRFIGIEMTEDYIPIIEGRLKNAEEKIDEGLF